MPMPAYVSLASKLQRAVRCLLILQGKSMDAVTFSANGDCFIAEDSRARKILPNRSILATSVNPLHKKERPEGVVTLQIQHKFEAVLQPDEQDDWEKRRLEMDQYFGATCDTMGIGDNNQDTGMNELAAAITAAGRWLATPDPNPPADPVAAAAEAKLVANNADMVNFRVDWIRRGTPFITRGEAEGHAALWVEIMHFEAGVSYAAN